MTYLLTNRHSSSKAGKKLLAGLACGGFLISLFYLIGPRLELSVSKIIYPALALSQEFKQNLKAGAVYLIPDDVLRKENAVLKEELAESRIGNFENQITQIENEYLLERLAYMEEGDTTSAAILLMPPATLYDILIIDRGEKDGVAVGAQVLFGERIALGQVEKVWNDRGSVKLYSSAGLKTSALVERTGAMVEIEGEGGGNFKLEAPMDFDIKEGDVLILPGIPMRAVALVAGVEIDETSSFLTAYLRSPAPLTGSSPVYIISP